MTSENRFDSRDSPANNFTDLHPLSQKALELFRETLIEFQNSLRWGEVSMTVPFSKGVPTRVNATPTTTLK